MASNAQKKQPVKKRKANGYAMPGHIPKGEIMKDISNNKWVINISIGVGGFGEIYSAAKESDGKQCNYVVKVEPSENGPLFCEKTVYLKIGKKEDIEDYMKSRKLKTLGMPRFYGCGTHSVADGTKYRFLVMERYGKDLWSIFLDKGRIFPTSTVFKIGIQILDVLEYIHSKLYVHADIKGANLLLGVNKGTENQVYLVDFGLAARYATEYKPNPKKAHNGTLEYTSRDAHVGVTTRRGDIEILGYNMLQWVASSLPWEKSKNPTDVETQKKDKMRDSNKFVKSWVKDAAAADILCKYFQSICNMDPVGEPDYDELRRTLRSGAGSSSTAGKLLFSPVKAPKTPTKTSERVTKTSTKTTSKVRDTSGEPVSKRTRTNVPKVHYGDEDDEKDADDDEEEEEDDGDLFKITPPNKRKSEKTVKRSWKDAPTIVSCSEMYSGKKF